MRQSRIGGLQPKNRVPGKALHDFPSPCRRLLAVSQLSSFSFMKRPPLASAWPFKRSDWMVDVVSLLALFGALRQRKGSQSLAAVSKAIWALIV